MDENLTQLMKYDPLQPYSSNLIRDDALIGGPFAPRHNMN